MPARSPAQRCFRRGARAPRMKNSRAIPAVGKVLAALSPTALPRPLLTQLVRRHLAALRASEHIPSFEQILQDLHRAVDDLRLARLQPVINGTGILIHTNLGRAPLHPEALAAVQAAGRHYNNLEFDLARGARGGRADDLERNLALLCGADAATVVNNCAAALILILRHFTARKKEVIISRGELIQIGGGFRIPEILEVSGAKLREVGTTNRTTLEDYAKAIGSDTAMILKVHRSNFFMGGFVESPATEALAQLARAKRIPCVEDLGSGAVCATEKLAAIEHEPTPAEILRSGVDLVCFSGDKLFGGPQAGLIAGKKRHVAALRRNPFFRALRCDKLILAALQSTLDLHLAGRSAELPALAMMQLSLESLPARAERLRSALQDRPLTAEIGTGNSQVGGGTLPRARIPSITLEIVPNEESLDHFAERLRRGPNPVIGYLAGGKLKLDLRTIFPEQEENLLAALR